MPDKSRAVAIFDSGGGHWLDPLLKKGFRHCYCCIDDGKYWVLVDAKIGIPEVRAVANNDFDMATYCRSQGRVVIETEVGDQVARGPWLLANCVGMMKAVLGIRSFSITPHQLYKHMRRR